MHSTQRAYLGVRARAFRIYREIAGGEKFKIGVFKWTLFNISVLASQYSGKRLEVTTLLGEGLSDTSPSGDLTFSLTDVI
jgi:hypothetical protein